MLSYLVQRERLKHTENTKKNPKKQIYSWLGAMHCQICRALNFASLTLKLLRQTLTQLIQLGTLRKIRKWLPHPGSQTVPSCSARDPQKYDRIVLFLQDETELKAYFNFLPLALLNEQHKLLWVSQTVITGFVHVIYSTQLSQRAMDQLHFITLFIKKLPGNDEMDE